MLNIAVIEDDQAVSQQVCRWVLLARQDAVVHTFFDRRSAEEALRRRSFDLIVLDIELGAERNAGVALLKEATKRVPTPVLVLSGMPADLYRGVMRALDAWDYMQKPVEQHDFIETLLDVLRLIESQREQHNLVLDPLKHPRPVWKGQRLNLPATAQRVLGVIYQRRNERNSVATYDDLYAVVATGKTRDNIRRQVTVIKAAFREIDPGFDCIVAEPMKGYRWSERS